MRVDGTLSTLTVFFEEPFWVGVFARTQSGKTTVCRVVFGAEPRDAEVYDLVLRDYADLRFSPAVDDAQRKPARSNPKRMQRVIQRQLASNGVGTKAQQALQLDRERRAGARRAQAKARKQAENEARFALRQAKRKEKRRGH